MARVKSINMSDQKGIPKDPIDSGLFIENFGLKDDSHGGDWHRQVSVLDQGSIDKIAKLGIEGLTPGRFAENITTEGIRLHELPVGAKLQIGETLQEVTQIGKECHTRCEIYHRVGACVMPLEGIFTKILKGGLIKPGDEIKILA